MATPAARSVPSMTCQIAMRRKSPSCSIVTAGCAEASQRLTDESTRPVSPNARVSAISSGASSAENAAEMTSASRTAMAVLVPVTTREPTVRRAAEPMPRKWCSRGAVRIQSM